MRTTYKQLPTSTAMKLIQDMETALQDIDKITKFSELQELKTAEEIRDKVAMKMAKWIPAEVLLAEFKKTLGMA